MVAVHPRPWNQRDIDPEACGDIEGSSLPPSGYEAILTGKE